MELLPDCLLAHMGICHSRWHHHGQHSCLKSMTWLLQGRNINVYVLLPHTGPSTNPTCILEADICRPLKDPTYQISKRKQLFLKVASHGQRPSSFCCSDYGVVRCMPPQTGNPRCVEQPCLVTVYWHMASGRGGERDHKH